MCVCMCTLACMCTCAMVYALGGREKVGSGSGHKADKAHALA